MKSTRLRALAGLTFVLFFSSFLHAQQDGYVFVYLGILDPDTVLSAPQRRVLENSLTNTLLEISRSQPYSFLFPEDGMEVLVRLQPSAGRDLQVRNLSSDWQPLARGFMSAEINRVGESYYLDLLIHSRSTGRVLLTQQISFPSFETLTTQLPGTTYALFGLSRSPSEGLSLGLSQQSSEIRFHTSPSLALIQGTWIGDRGLGRVSIARDGSATAELGENGADGTMKLQVRVENDLIRIRQDEPNAPKMYMSSFPYAISTQIVALARPMTWEFRLTQDAARLIGKKFTSYVTVEQGNVTRVDNTYFRDATWDRVSE